MAADKGGDDWAILSADAGKLSDKKLLKIYGLLEQLAEKPGIERAFDAMRPRLAELRPPRRPTVSRLLFRPAEDLLDDPVSYGRRLNRVSRATLGPAWRALKDRIDPAVIADAQLEIARSHPRDGRALAKAGAPLWAAGAAAVEGLLRDCRANLKVQVALFGRDADILDQLDMVGQVLAVGSEIEELKLALPERPIGELAEGHVDTIKKTMTALGRENPHAATPALIVLSARMKRPGDLLKLLQDVRLGGTPQEKEGITKELSGVVVGNLLRQSQEIERNPGNLDEPGGLAATAERLTEGLNSVNDTVLNLRDKEMSKKVDGARAEIGNFVVRTIVNDVDKALIGTLFDGSGVAGDDQVRKAEQLALALRRSAKLAPHLGIKREVDTKITDVRRQVEAGIETALRTHPPVHGKPDAETQRQMFNGLRVIEILAGSDEAERLYRQWKQRLG